MGTKIIFTDAELALMSTSELKRIRYTADNLGVTRTVEKVDAILLTRAPRKGGKLPLMYQKPVKDAEREIIRAQQRLAQEFDLSPEAANTKHPHGIFGKKGGMKPSGDMMGKKFEYESYQSYRNGDQITAIGIRSAKFGDVPQVFVGYGKDVVWFSLDDLPAAIAEYERIISQIAPKKETENV